MSTKFPKLSCGLSYGTGLNGERVCLGAHMGRSNTRPADPELVVRLSLRRLPFVDGDYDQGGAYWGSPANLWRAVSATRHPWLSNWDESALTAPEHIEIFVRAESRAQAKNLVLELVPNAKFYR